jgi:hypothetical protein
MPYDAVATEEANRTNAKSFKAAFALDRVSGKHNPLSAAPKAKISRLIDFRLLHGKKS